jgi:hypothetical protein
VLALVAGCASTRQLKPGVAKIGIIQLAAGKDWLHEATKEVSKHWRYKREYRSAYRGKVSPDASPKVTPAEQKACVGEAEASGETNLEKAI